MLNPKKSGSLRLWSEWDDLDMCCQDKHSAKSREKKGKKAAEDVP